MAGQGNFFDAADDPVVDQMQEKRRTDIRQGNASAGASSASAGKSRADTVTEEVTRPYTVRKAAADADYAEKQAQQGPPKSDSQVRKEAAAERAAVVRAQMARLIGKYKADIKGQPASRGFGLFEKWFDEPTGPIPALPSLSSFNTSAQQILPLVRPLVAQSSKEGDSNTEMQVFERYIPSASDNDQDIEDKIRGLDMLLAGMAEGKQPSEVVQLGVKPRSIDDIEKDLKAAGTGAEAVVDGNATTASTPQGQQIKGARLSPGATAALTKYRFSPDFSPEGYAKLIVAKGLEENVIDPAQAETIYQDNLRSAQEFFKTTPPDKAGPGGDYTETDRRAREQTGFGDALSQAGANLPESAANLIQGAAALPVDAIASLVSGERVGALKSTTDLAAELIKSAGGEPSGPTMQAVSQMLDERYGGWDALKNTMVTDPAGFAGDLSLVLSGGGSLAARAPGAVGKAGRVAEVAGRAIDPLSAVVAGAETLPKVASAVTPQFVKDTPGTVTGHVMGLATGVPGGEGYRRAANIGYERGKSGPSPRSDNFLDNLRGAPPEKVVSEAEAAVNSMREDASQRYQQDMQATNTDATVLSFNGIDRVLRDMKDRAYYKGKLKDPRAAAAHDKIFTIVDEWRGFDPAEYHTPAGMDALKQRVSDVVDEFSTGNDRRAASIATGTYKAIRNEIARQVPSYSKAMKNYERAAEQLRNIRKTFSLNPTASVDTQLRKLQSIMRNNANTSYGYRRSLADLMERNGGGQIIDSLAAQSVSSMQPRSLAGIPATGAAVSGLGGLVLPGVSAALNPAMLAAIPFTSPRLMGEASYYAGAGAGKVAKGADATLGALSRLYNDNPAKALVMAQMGSRQQDLEELASRYAIDDPASVTQGGY